MEVSYKTLVGPNKVGKMSVNRDICHAGGIYQ